MIFTRQEKILKKFRIDKKFSEHTLHGIKRYKI